MYVIYFLGCYIQLTSVGKCRMNDFTVKTEVPI